jgi:CRISPR-associated endonuclease/helicase Cas3
LVRSAIENRLDTLLARHHQEKWLASPLVRQLLDGHTEPNQIVVVLATPVAEVGRDHDYDWGVVEPSSMRSIIQLAGRIRRHRHGSVKEPNLYLLETNFKHLRSGMSAPAFCRPGFESKLFPLRSHSLADLLAPEQWQRIDASSRIQVRADADPTGNLVDLEHEVTRQWVEGANAGEALKVLPASLWWQYRSPLCAALQRKFPFRYDPLGRQRYLLLPEEEKLHFKRLEKDGELVGVDNLKADIELDIAQGVSVFAVTDYVEELDALGEVLGMESGYAARRYGYIDLPATGCDNGWEYHSVLGFNKIR